jgi:hypothetical protein
MRLIAKNYASRGQGARFQKLQPQPAQGAPEQRFAAPQHNRDKGKVSCQGPWSARKENALRDTAQGEPDPILRRWHRVKGPALNEPEVGRDGRRDSSSSGEAYSGGMTAEGAARLPPYGTFPL